MCQTNGLVSTSSVTDADEKSHGEGGREKQEGYLTNLDKNVKTVRKSMFLTSKKFFPCVLDIVFTFLEFVFIFFRFHFCLE